MVVAWRNWINSKVLHFIVTNRFFVYFLYVLATLIFRKLCFALKQNKSMGEIVRESKNVSHNPLLRPEFKF